MVNKYLSKHSDNASYTNISTTTGGLTTHDGGHDEAKPSRKNNETLIQRICTPPLIPPPGTDGKIPEKVLVTRFQCRNCNKLFRYANNVIEHRVKFHPHLPVFDFREVKR